MAISGLLHHKKPTAITVSQFVNSFQRIWHDSGMRGGQRARDTRFPSRLGLAISGGADSMALAYLCREWEKSTTTSSKSDTPRVEVTVTAFIVDHRAREESSREAATVASWLAEMGITTHILPLDWSSLTASPQTLPAFETHARRLRFQALGRACRAAHIDALLTGHHRDDAVETTLWRLCTGARGAGLAGIPECTGIPECHGMFGVVGSRGVELLRSAYPFHPYSDHPRVSSDQHDHDHHHHHHPAARTAPMATGTLPIIRPLLAFPKPDLLATCAFRKIPFVSDPTNFDPTLTPRNAIRSLLAQHKLPRALREGSMLGLMGASRRLIRTAERESETLLGLCEVGGFVPETGVVGVRFPSLVSCGDSVGKGKGEGQGEAAVERSVQTQIQALALRRITELVSPFPDNHFPLRAFEPFVARVFRGKQEQEQQEQEQSFTLGGVLFQPLSLAPKKKGEESLFLRVAATHAHGSDTPKNSTSNDQKTWLLSRQPYMKNRLPVLDFHLCTEGSVTTTERQEQEQEQEQEQWHIWDNRYWFRVGWSSSSSSSSTPPKSIPNPNLNPGISSQNPEPRKIHLRIRPLQKADLNILRQLSPTQTAHHHDPCKHANKTDGEQILAQMGTKADADSDSESGSVTDNVQNGNQQGRIAADPQALTRLLAQVSPGRTRFTIPVLVQVLVRQQQQQQQQRQQQQQTVTVEDGEEEVDTSTVAAPVSDTTTTTTTTTLHTHTSTSTTPNPTSPPSPSPDQISRSQQGWNTPKTRAPPPPPPAAEEEEIPLALPTLDLWLPSSPPLKQEWPEGKSLRWEWRYKMVDRAGTLRLMRWESEAEGEQ